MARTTRRRFVKDRHTGLITIVPRTGTTHRKTGAADDQELLDALVEAEEMLAPVFAERRVAPVDCIPLLADAMYIRLTGEVEIPSSDLRGLLCEYILTVWSQGSFTPGAAFPFTLEEIISVVQGPHEKQEAPLDDVQIRDALSAALGSPLSVEDGQPSPYERLKYDMRDIDQARDALIERGLRAFEQRQYAQAAQFFYQAGQADMLDESETWYYLAMTKLRLLDFDDASYLFEVDAQDREGEAPLSWLLSEWCAVSAVSSHAEYLAWVRDDMHTRGDPIAYKQELFAFDYEEFEDDALQAVASAFFAYLRGEYERCLDLLDGFEPEDLEIPDWFAPFWSAMARASRGEYDEANVLLRDAFVFDIPRLLLLPLRWFEQSQPDFFERFVTPLFTECDLWKQVAARKEREQIMRQEWQGRAKWWVDHLDEEFPGFSQAFQQLDSLRERGQSGSRPAEDVCYYLSEPLGEEFAQTYAKIAELQHLARGNFTLPVLLVEIPAPRAPRPSTYLVSAFLEQLGDPLAHKRISEARKKARLIQQLKECRVELIILTHMEGLATPAGTKVLLREIEWVRQLFVKETAPIPLLLVEESSVIESIREASADWDHLLRELVTDQASSI